MMVILEFLCIWNAKSKKGLKNSDLNGHSKPDLCAADEVLHQLSYKAGWYLRFSPLMLGSQKIQF